MNVLLTGTDFVNKGAELMMHAVLDELRTWTEVEEVAMPLEAGTFSERAASGVRHLVGRKIDRLPAIEPLIAAAGNVIPRRIAGSRGFVRARDIGLVLDASGYSYSDRSGSRPALRSARTYARYASAGATVVLLPQAFGPFEDGSVRAAFRDVLSSTSMAFARDEESLEYLQHVAPESVRLALAPDFTIPRPGIATGVEERFAGRACLVPNVRMVRDTDPAIGAWYLGLLARLSDDLTTRGLDPFILLHEPRDAAITDAVLARASSAPETVTHRDPRVLKGIIGSARVTIGSRYHALVGALSSGVPAVGIGWSHKYAALFADFGVPDLCIRNQTQAGEVIELVSHIAQDMERDAIRTVLEARTTTLSEAVTAMWAAVRAAGRS